MPRSPDDKPKRRGKSPRSPLPRRVEDAFRGLNPILVVLAIGLVILNITLYIGLSLSHGGRWSFALAPVPFAYPHGVTGN